MSSEDTQTDKLAEPSIPQKSGKAPAQRPRRRRSARPREELRSAILSAATELFSTQGFHGPTTRDIAKRAGVATPALYRFFVDKRDIYEKCCEHAASERYAFLQTFTNSPDSDAIVLYKILRASISRRLHRRSHHTLVDWIIFEGDDVIIHDFLDLYFNSEYFKKYVSVAESASDKKTGSLRLMILDSFLSSLPNIMKFFPKEHHISLEDIDAFLVNTLSIMFPAVPWGDIARQCAQA
jgi:hypothetical protein